MRGRRRDSDKHPARPDWASGVGNRAASLHGVAIHRVRYFELGDETGRPLWNENADLDSLDFGVELDLDSGRTVSIIWDWGFDGYDLKLVDSALRPSEIADDAAVVVSEVGHTSRWATVLGVPIADAVFRWEPGWETERSSPQDLVLTFANAKRVWIMAAEWRGGEWLAGGMDHVTVVFDPTVAERLGRHP